MYILVVENENTGEALCDLVLLWGHETSLATTGRQALESATAQRPDLVILDLGLPDMPGEAVATALKALSVPPYVVAYSGFHRRAPGALDAGCDRFVLKPQLEQLASALQVVTRRQQDRAVK